MRIPPEPEPEPTNEYIIFILKRIEERTKKVEKKINQLSWGVPLIFVGLAIGFWLGFG